MFKYSPYSYSSAHQLYAWKFSGSVLCVKIPWITLSYYWKKHHTLIYDHHMIFQTSEFFIDSGEEEKFISRFSSASSILYSTIYSSEDSIFTFYVSISLDYPYHIIGRSTTTHEYKQNKKNSLINIIQKMGSLRGRNLTGFFGSSSALSMQMRMLRWHRKLLQT